MEIRKATVADADNIAELLHAFNKEFGVPTPTIEVLSSRLRVVLDSPMTFAIIAGTPAFAVALVTLRTNVWFEGPVAILDEMYVSPSLRNQGIGSAIMDEFFNVARATGISMIEVNVDEGDIDAHRFYEQHAFNLFEADTGERAFYIYREI